MPTSVRLFLLLLLVNPVLSIYTLEEVHGLSDFLRCGDKRLVRLKPHQGSFLRTGTFCEVLDSLIVTLNESTDPKVKMYSADAITTCLLHRPENRNAVGMNPIFHETVIEYLREEPHVAAELIWAATENNYINLSEFIEKNVVEELFRVMRYYEYSVAAMWAAAALANMGTSYCGVGPCKWRWNEFSKLKPTQEVEVDGLVARMHVAAIDGIWDLLLDQVCSSVAFEEIRGITMPSKAIRPADVASLVPWAMAGLIKTLALRPASRQMLEATVPCLCILSKSDDPLERRNSWEAMYHLGRDGSCHTNNARIGVCIDMPFQTQDKRRCSDLKTTDDCSSSLKDKDTEIRAIAACCTCGGGDYLANAFISVPEDDL